MNLQVHSSIWDSYSQDVCYPDVVLLIDDLHNHFQTTAKMGESPSNYSSCVATNHLQATSPGVKLRIWSNIP
jgi:hypothetical protein